MTCIFEWTRHHGDTCKMVHPKNFGLGSCFVVVIDTAQLYPHPMWLLECLWNNQTIALVSLKQSWNISVNLSHERSENHGVTDRFKPVCIFGNWSKRRQTETSTTKTSTNQNVDKPKRRQTKTSTDQNVDKPKRRQTKTSTDHNVDKPKRRQTKTSTL